MWNFDDSREFVLVHHFEFPAIYTWGDKDKDKREAIRRSAVNNLLKGRPLDYKWFGFHIKVKRGVLGRDLDIENIPKLILDAFSSKQIDQDNSAYREHPKMRMYPDDTLRYIRAIQIEGDFTHNEGDSTEVWILGKK